MNNGALRYFCVLTLCFTACAQQSDDVVAQARQCVDRFNIKVIAYYFPQFYPFQENNRFWGDGFTEWTLLKKYQGNIKRPHVDVGYYTMLDYATRKRQAQMAKEHGISAFCYYHYWFKDTKVMYAGIEKILEDGQSDIPFIFCWANESWTRNWDGSEQEVMLKQEYGTEVDWVAHYHYLAQFFKHPNYIKENNCPIICIYKVDQLGKDISYKMFTLWKRLAKKDGFDGLKIIAICVADKGCEVDGIAEHQPNAILIKRPQIFAPMRSGKNVLIEQKEFFEEILQNKRTDPVYYYGIMHSFDNASRRINRLFIRFINLSYGAFENLILGTIMKITQEPNKGSNFVFLNSWNEWTEQAMVEPNDHDGYELLNIIKRYFGK